MKKRSIRVFMISLFATVLSLGLSACEKNDSHKEEEAQLDAVSSSLEGILTAYTGTSLSVETKDGETLSFDNCSHAKLDLKNGIVPGNEVLLVYVGSIKEGDTSNVKVRKIIVEQDNTGLVEKKMQEVVNGSEASGATYPTVGYAEPASGVSVQETNGTGTILGGVNVRADAKSGSTLLGQLGNGEQVTVTGICENGWYRIIYQDQTAFIWKDYILY